MMQRLLLDTHTFLWWLDKPEQIAATAQQAIADLGNEVFLSVVSLWEISIKASIGKMNMPVDLLGQAKLHNFQILQINADHALKTYTLPLHHGDPFDRLLIAQSMVEGLVLITRDKYIPQYGIPLIVA